MNYIALLRAVNVAGYGVVAMSDLRAAAEGLGFKDVRTLLQSGNLVFEAPSSATANERKLEKEIERRFHLTVPVIVRSSSDLAKIVAKNPFTKEARDAPALLHVMFLKDKPAKAKERLLRATITGRERLALKGDALYVVYPDGAGRSKLTAALVDRELGTTATARNWNTVQKLLAASKA